MKRTLCTLITFAACVGSVPLQALATEAPVVAASTATEAECQRAAHPSGVQGRVVELGAQGIVPLRSFVLRTRAIYQLDLMETVAWLDQRRALLAACGQRAARANSVTAAR